MHSATGTAPAALVSLTCCVCGGDSPFLFEKHGYSIHRCGSCGLGFVANLPSPAELEEFYARSYYDSDHDWGYHTEYGVLERGLKKMYSGFVRRVRRRRGGRPVRRVLDVGCAYGFFLDVARESWDLEEAVGLDITPEAERRAAEQGYTFHSGFVEQVDLPPNHFDLVFMGDAFEHVHDPHVVADRLVRTLAPGGTLVITTVDFGAWLPRLFGRNWRLMTPPEHLFFWSRRSLREIFETRGLRAWVGNYWLHYPKSYANERFRAQFGFPAFFLPLIPVSTLPIPSLDAVLGIFERPESTSVS